ncbi:MFS transporter [Kineococcus sp. SYSU DK006]|uniref:MFS transporter n=1 Tax=Kineococcus sp. SYSU DK006 TaxID=3383127 RepID=UPI003D7EBA7A
MSATFRSLRHRDYRLWAAGALISNTGTWMQRVAQDWLVIQVLTNGSGTAGGITTGLQFGPILLLAPLAGTIADRFPQRRTLMATQAGLLVVGLAMAALVLSGHARLWHVYVLATLLGCVSAIDGPVRQTFVSQLVPPEDLPNAIGLNSASFNSARLVGPALAGLLIAWIGTGPVFLVNALTFLAPLAMLHLMRPAHPVPRTERLAGGGMREGLRYVRTRPDLLAVFVLVGVVGTFGLNFQLTSALMTSVRYEAGSAAYGFAGTVLAVGSLTGALVAARRERPRHRLLVGAGVAFGLTATLAALMPTYPLYLLVLPLLGLASLTLLTTANATVQMSTEPRLRGRVMAIYMSLVQGGTVVGGPFVGWVGSRCGPEWSILVGSIPSTLVAVGVGAFLLRRARVRVAWRRSAPHLRLVPVSGRGGEEEAAAA